MERGRYTHYSQRRTPQRKRTIHLSGSFEDKNKYIRCWNCGFIVDTERDLGDSETSGNYETDAQVYSQSLVMGGESPYSTIMVMDRLGMTGTMILEDANGDAITDYYTPRLPQVNKGCAFCGCTNLV